MNLRSVSYGGGVQSTALLVLAAQGRIDYPLFLFANVGADSEHPASLRYVREVAMPYAEAHGIELVELCRVPRKGRHAGPCAGAGTIPRLVADDVRSTEANGVVTMRATCPSCGERLALSAAPWAFPDHQRAETLWAG